MTKLESLKAEIFAPMSETEAAMVKGGMAEATSSTVWSNTFVNGQYIGNDKDIFTDESPAQPADQIAAA